MPMGFPCRRVWVGVGVQRFCRFPLTLWRENYNFCVKSVWHTDNNVIFAAKMLPGGRMCSSALESEKEIV